MLQNLLHEIRISLRILFRQRLQSIIVVLILGLATGALTSVFSVVRAVMFQPYGPLDVDKWVYLWEQRLSSNQGAQLTVSVPNFRDWKRETSSVFSDMVLWLPWSYTASGSDGTRPEQIRAAVISPEIFSASGVVPAAGRFLLPSDSAGSERVVVLSYAFWQRAYAGNPALIGSKINLNLAPHTVIGIAPEGFSFPPETATDAWTPAPAAMLATTDRSARGYRIAARLRPGVSPRAAQAALTLVAQRLASEYPEDKDYGAAVVPMREAVVGNFRTPLTALTGALAFALLLVCMNVAYLRAVNLESRRKEVLLRLALGAGQSRLVRQLLLETVLLFGAGGLLGLLLAPVVSRLLLSLVPTGQIQWLTLHNDPLIACAVFGATLLAAVLSGWIPALRASRSEPARALGSSGAVTNTSTLGRKLRNSALVAQVALTLIPLCGAGLLIRSFERLQSVNPGFDPDRRLSLMVYFPRTRYPAIRDIAATARRIHEEAAQIPGIRGAGLVQAMPFAPGLRWLQGISRTDPRAIVSFADVPLVRYTAVTAGYFDAMGIPLKAGRAINETDTGSSQPVVVINERLARDEFGSENPIGKQLWINHSEALTRSKPKVVVGVVADSRLDGLEQTPDPSAWVSIDQQETGDTILRNLFVVVHTDFAPGNALAGLRERIRGIDNDMAVSEVATMQDRLSNSLWRQRFGAIVVGLFSMASLCIAVMGVFGMTSYLVACRTYEIGVRIALGAAPESILRNVLGQGVIMALIGVALGSLGALALTRILSSFLFGVTSTDPATFVAVAAILIAAAAAASYFPARRAASVDPLIALRME